MPGRGCSDLGRTKGLRRGDWCGDFEKDLGSLASALLSCAAFWSVSLTSGMRADDRLDIQSKPCGIAVGR